jgi:hypothetical protein
MHPEVKPGRGASAQAEPESRLALVHRVLVPAEPHPKEYAILLTSRRSVFILQAKTRSGFVLRGEMRYGTALVTDVVPRTLEDYAQTALDSLAAHVGNFAVPHESVVSLAMGRGEPQARLLDVFVRLTMRRQGETFQVYSFVMDWHTASGGEASSTFYAVPLGAYFKPRRQTQGREAILREYALGVLEAFRAVLPAGTVRG